MRDKSLAALRWMRNGLAIVGAISICWFAWSYVVEKAFEFPWHWEEQSRLPSPSREKELVGFQGNRGAMSSYRYAFFIVKRGERIDPNAKSGYDAVFVCSGPAPNPVWATESRVSFPVQDVRVFFLAPWKKEFGVAIEVLSLPPVR